LRVVLATVGSLGDLHPYIAVARALLARGAHPVVATVPEYRADVEREGLEFAPVGPGFAAFGDYRELMKKIFDGPDGVEFIVRKMVMPHLRTAYADLERAVEGADLLVSHPLTMVVPLIAEQKRLRWAATILSPINLMSSYDRPLFPGAEWMRALPRPIYRIAFKGLRLVSWRWEAPLRAFRRELGLPSRGLAMLEGQFSPELNLGLFDPQLAQPQPDWPRNLHITGAPLHDGPAQDTRELEAFLAAGAPPLVFALGSSAVWIAGDFWQQAIDAARVLGRRAVLIVGPAQIANSQDVRAFAYLPYSAVFPRAHAVIHQGGIGTLSQALRAGRPQLVVPFAFDQPDNARRAAGLGVARVVPAKKVTASTLAKQIALLDSACEARAQRLARELRETDGAARAAAELMRFAAC